MDKNKVIKLFDSGDIDMLQYLYPFITNDMQDLYNEVVKLNAEQLDTTIYFKKRNELLNRLGFIINYDEMFQKLELKN